MGLEIPQELELRVEVAPAITLSPPQQNALDTLNAELSRPFWQRFSALRETETRCEDEQIELIGMVTVMEEWNIRRLSLLEEMAWQRGMHFPELMQCLNIQNHPDAGSETVC